MSSQPASQPPRQICVHCSMDNQRRHQHEGGMLIKHMYICTVVVVAFRLHVIGFEVRALGGVWGVVGCGVGWSDEWGRLMYGGWGGVEW